MKPNMPEMAHSTDESMRNACTNCGDYHDGFCDLETLGFRRGVDWASSRKKLLLPEELEKLSDYALVKELSSRARELASAEAAVENARQVVLRRALKAQEPIEIWLEKAWNNNE